MEFYIGLMSGTSMDGIDAALVDLEQNVCKHFITVPYKPHVRQSLAKITNKSTHSVKEIFQLNTLVGEEFANAALVLLKAANMSKDKIIAIGSHGQTIAHDATETIPYTVQLGCAHTITEITKLPVVADFRTRDLVNKGQGAPLAPLYHREIFIESNTSPTIVVNIGGIANISFIDKVGSICGFDTGPGNCLLDYWIQKEQHKLLDEDGEFARNGKVIASLLNNLLDDPYFSKAYPKSLGKEYFDKSWLKNKLSKGSSPADIQATFVEFTVKSIAKAIMGIDNNANTIIVTGGGAKNKYLMERLQLALVGYELNTSDAYGISPDCIEAMLVAWLAKKRLDKIPIDTTPLTGAKKKSLLGVVYEP